MRIAYPFEMFRRRSVHAEPFIVEPVEPPWAALDPGIVDLVRLLWLAGFNPTDSGDGVTKPADERSIDGPHVVLVVSDPACLYAETNRLHLLLHRVGITLDPIGGAITVEASYDPAMGSGVIILCGATLAMPVLP